MSTRCQIRVIDASGKEYNVYHHHDGYFSGVGLELQEMLHKSKNAKDLLADMLFDYDGYEPTSLNHGDIEFFYILDFRKNEFYGWQVDWKENLGKIWNDDRCHVVESTKIDLLLWENTENVE